MDEPRDDLCLYLCFGRARNGMLSDEPVIEDWRRNRNNEITSAGMWWWFMCRLVITNDWSPSYKLSIKQSVEMFWIIEFHSGSPVKIALVSFLFFSSFLVQKIYCKRSTILSHRLSISLELGTFQWFIFLSISISIQTGKKLQRNSGDHCAVDIPCGISSNNDQIAKIGLSIERLSKWLIVLNIFGKRNAQRKKMRFPNDKSNTIQGIVCTLFKWFSFICLSGANWDGCAHDFIHGFWRIGEIVCLVSCDFCVRVVSSEYVSDVNFPCAILVQTSFPFSRWVNFRSSIFHLFSFSFCLHFSRERKDLLNESQQWTIEIFYTYRIIIIVWWKKKYENLNNNNNRIEW